MGFTLDKSLIDKTATEIISLCNDKHLSIPEILTLIGRLEYSAGAALLSLKEDISLEDLKKLYLNDPNNLGAILMLRGLETQAFIEDVQLKT